MKFANLLVLISLLLTSCQSVWSQPMPVQEMVYQGQGTDKTPFHTLGFVDDDGSNNILLEIPDKFEKPMWSLDGKFLYGLSKGSGAYGGYPAYWSPDKNNFKACSKDLPYFEQIQPSGNMDNPYEAILINTFTIIVFDLSTCKQIKSLVDFTNGRGDKFLAGFSYSPENNLLLYGLIYETMSKPNHRIREYRLILFDLKTGQKIQLAEGINPAWSPDSSRFAYIGLDGLYVYHLEDKTTTKLVNQPFFLPWNSGSPWGLVTEPSWSPDGAWILYHSCPLNVVFSAKDCAIYKIPSGGGVPQMVIDHGMYPKWRP